MIAEVDYCDLGNLIRKWITRVMVSLYFPYIPYISRCIDANSIPGAVVAEWLSSWHEVRGSIPRLATRISEIGYFLLPRSDVNPHPQYNQPSQLNPHSAWGSHTPTSFITPQLQSQPPPPQHTYTHTNSSGSPRKWFRPQVLQRVYVPDS